MDNILTIHNYWDGLLLGIATFNEKPCIYERIFSFELDDYTNLYYLTLIDNQTFDLIMNDWNNWCNYMNINKHYKKWKSNINLDILAKKSINYHKYCKRAIFYGTYKNFYQKYYDIQVDWIS